MTEAQQAWRPPRREMGASVRPGAWKGLLG